MSHGSSIRTTVLKPPPPPTGLDIGFWILVGMVCFILSIGFNHYGFLHFEWKGYAPYHLGPGSIWHKIFNSRSLDLDTYAGRELSYLIDHIDIKAIALTVSLGDPIFVSVVHIVLSIFIGVWVAWFAARDLQLGTTLGLLLALLFWTTTYDFQHFLIRSAKILTATGTILTITGLWRLRLRAGTGSSIWWQLAELGIGAFLLAFSDRQGLFFLLIAWGATGLDVLFRRDRQTLMACIVLLGLIGAQWIYFHYLAPALTRHFFGYTPNFDFTRLDYAELFAKAGEYSMSATTSLGDSLRFMLGNIPLAALIALLVAGFFTGLFQAWKADWRQGMPAGTLIGIVLVLLWVMYALMILKHPAITWPDIKRVYYWLPTGALTLLALAAILQNLRAGNSGWRHAVATLLLIAAIVGNICALPKHREIFIHGHLHDFIVQAEDLRDALKPAGQAPQSVPPVVNDDPIYRALLPYRR